MFLLGTWAAEFGLDPAQVGRLAGIGIWPFAVSHHRASAWSSTGSATRSRWSSRSSATSSGRSWASARTTSRKNGDKDDRLQLLYWGSLILGLSNGTVEAFINPVVATMFSRNKTKWLNILHAGWPGGLVLAGMITIVMAATRSPWSIKVGIIAAAGGRLLHHADRR